MTLKITILGCGSSGGVPRGDGFWGRCNPDNIKNYRTRCSILVEQVGPRGTTTILIDTSPDLRAQFLKAQVKKIDALLYTHDHADQTHGIDDLRHIVYLNRKRIDAYIDDETAATLVRKFDYIFAGRERGGYPALLNYKKMPEDYGTLTINGEGGKLEIKILPQIHGDIKSLGFRIGNFAYCNDVNILPEKTLAALMGLDLFIVDALRYDPHPSHAHLDLAKEWIEKIKPGHSILTNMHIDFDYDELKSQLPENIEPAYDGMVIEI